MCFNSEGVSSLEDFLKDHIDATMQPFKIARTTEAAASPYIQRLLVLQTSTKFYMQRSHVLQTNTNLYMLQSRVLQTSKNRVNLCLFIGNFYSLPQFLFFLSKKIKKRTFPRLVHLFCFNICKGMIMRLNYAKKCQDKITFERVRFFCNSYTIGIQQVQYIIRRVVKNVSFTVTYVTQFLRCQFHHSFIEITQYMYDI